MHEAGQGELCGPHAATNCLVTLQNKNPGAMLGQRDRRSESVWPRADHDSVGISHAILKLSSTINA
jgi:hypothetical protein